MNSFQIQIPDMQSAHCQLRVSKALSSIPGVTVDNVTPGTVEVSIDQDTSRTKVYDAIRESGYTVAGVATPDPVTPEDAGRTYKTNIHCQGCAAAVAPGLDEAVGAGGWRVDVGSPDKVLTVTARNIPEEDILRAVRDAGYTIQAF